MGDVVTICSTYMSNDLWKLTITENENEIIRYISSFTLKFLIKACKIISNKPGEVILTCDENVLSTELNINNFDLHV